LQENSIDTGNRYKYKKVVPNWISVRILENNTICKIVQVKVSNSLQSLNKRVNQVIKWASE